MEVIREDMKACDEEIIWDGKRAFSGKTHGQLTQHTWYKKTRAVTLFIHYFNFVKIYMLYVIY